MNKELASILEKRLGISQEQIVREEYEMIILKTLFESEVGESFVFTGGTALRLAHGSPRFSEDLDFSIIGDFDRKKLKQSLEKIADQDESLQLKEALQKRFTYFGLFKVKEDSLHQPLSIKFEASTRPVKMQKDKDYQLLVLDSQVTNLTVLAQVASLEWIEKEKKTIKPPRVRDIFDLWFIAQRLDKPAKMDFSGWETKVVKRELHKLLPENDRRLLEQWLPKR
jgi:predicted nucleotidyltransferase component of viral defense system